MSEANEVSKDINFVDNNPKVYVKDDPSSEEVPSHQQKAEENPMLSPAQVEEDDGLSKVLECNAVSSGVR
ncbi:hypothetical protein CTI12_AA237040 [Artemisia annua]|uniref:Uncharacterized protein n=1 Tax=Artemisia annua TaxID=35608 RepID=A0A2U1NRB9_ARTAN|nr:hypothetical protein CTI12_AA237040 [Artemisia annua]